MKRLLSVVMGANDRVCGSLDNGAFQHGEGVIPLVTNGVVLLVSDWPLFANLRLCRSVFCWLFV